MTNAPTVQLINDWLDRQFDADASFDQRRLAHFVTVNSTSDAIVLEMIAVSAEAICRAIHDEHPAPVTMRSILESESSHRGLFLRAAFQQANVHPTYWIVDEFEQIFRALTNASENSKTALGSDLELILQALHKHRFMPSSPSAPVTDKRTESWASGFRQAVKRGHVVSYSHIAKLKGFTRRQSRKYLSDMSKSNVTIANHFSLPLRTVEQVLNGCPGPAQINAFLRATGFRHAAFPVVEIPPWVDELPIAALHTDPASAVEVVDQLMERHRLAARAKYNGIAIQNPEEPESI